ncbi:adapter protein MecA 1/2 [Melghirimyces profundicolus]|uniref:Adapter protein MecA 1/2 n=1 Tax=Melghirimyces profundicolus TaxID=1242148 RepID=A0A2T6BUY6_9BACL|nr:genetic competence negative regulator [Melghirimyces profundicolus]PTX59874.1 adapter protein MecA 1/2 [Melghirimyces profundicolus]
MRVERLSRDKIRFYLSMDDLMERGIEKEDMWRDIPKVHELFNDMMDQAYQELGFEISGPVAVEVFALPAQGMVVVVTRGRTPSPSDLDELDGDDMYELEVTLEESDQVIFQFQDFEYLVQAARDVQPLMGNAGRVYAYRDRYFLVLDTDMETETLQQGIAVLSEFGEASTVTEHVLQEYGKTIWDQEAVGEIIRYFS